MTSGNTHLDVLAIAPHPDDVEIFAGATLLHLIDRGLRVGILDLTRGELGSRGSQEIRHEEAREASVRLGLAVRENLDLPDGDVRDDHPQRIALAAAIRRLRPSLLLGPASSDYHPDHIAASALVSSAYFFSGLERLDLDLPPHRPTQYLSYLGNLGDEPRFVFDATPYWPRKRHVVSAFSSQISQGPPTDRSHLILGRDVLDRMEIRGRHFGLLAGCEYGEPFTSARPPRMGEFPVSPTP